MAIDPICGMTVDERTAISAERDGKNVHFCCEHCPRKFVVDEESRLESQRSSVEGQDLAELTLFRGPKKTMRNVPQNFFFAFMYRLIGIPVSAGVLVPVFGMSALLNPMIATAA
jgi:YHS domain-containing protein